MVTVPRSQILHKVRYYPKSKSLRDFLGGGKISLGEKYEFHKAPRVVCHLVSSQEAAGGSNFLAHPKGAAAHL